MSLIPLVLASMAGVPLTRVLILAVVVQFPAVAALILGVVVVRSRHTEEASAALFCQVVSGELRAGAPLRSAISTALGTSSRLVDADLISAPMDELARVVAAGFDHAGKELELTVRAAHRTGGRAAEIFHEVGDMVLARAEIAREIRVATAPVRATAGLLIFVPCLYVAYIATTGRLASLIATSEQRLVGLIGFGLFGVGLAVALSVMWRAK